MNRMHRTKTLSTLVLTLWLLATSCSFQARARDPARYKPYENPDCIVSSAAQLVDYTTWGGILIAGFLAAKLSYPDHASATLTASFAASMPFGISALKGFAYRDECEALWRRRRDFMAWTRRTPLGSLDGPCTTEGTCNSGLVCDRDANTCVPDGPQGTDGQRCYGNGTCNDGLQCDAAVMRCRISSIGEHDAAPSE